MRGAPDDSCHHDPLHRFLPDALQHRLHVRPGIAHPISHRRGCLRHQQCGGNLRVVRRLVDALSLDDSQCAHLRCHRQHAIGRRHADPGGRRSLSHGKRALGSAVFGHRRGGQCELHSGNACSCGLGRADGRLGAGRQAARAQREVGGVGEVLVSNLPRGTQGPRKSLLPPRALERGRTQRESEKEGQETGEKARIFASPQR
mmetsp:Transcript_46488/g.99539  ORF Transcript_46488/g.99539 Transcript_46488/m.99539 type:complete len:202 (-) Transcript_46488:2135-2740(-)